VNELAEVHEQWREDLPIGGVKGEIDASNSAAVGTRLRALLANHSLGLIVDLTATTYIDSAGINMLFVLGDELRTRQQELRIVVGPSTPIARMLAITGLDRTYRAHATVEDALSER
jgi:anti-sigma B factor antagonist